MDRALGADRTPRAPTLADRDGPWVRSGSSSAAARHPVTLVVRCAIRGLVVLSYPTGVASAHLPQGSGGPISGPIMGLAMLTVASVVVSLLCGFALVVLGRRWRHRSTSRLGVVFGALVFVSGGLAVSSAVLNDLVPAVGGTLIGVFLVGPLWSLVSGGEAISNGSDETRSSGRCAHAALGAIVAHRTIEGLTVAAIYTAGSTVGVLGAVVLAGHATVETVAVGGLHLADRTRAFLAMCLVQLGFVVGTVLGQVTTVSLPSTHRITMLALIGGVLLVVGGSETYVRLRSDPSSGSARRV